MIVIKKLNLKWVAETIGNDYKNWKRGETILIQAQTGTGKTYFIKNVLIDYLPEYEKMLLVCNRLNLKRQLKIDLLNKYNEKIPTVGDSEIVDIEELDNLKTIKNITITSYHAIDENLLIGEYEHNLIDMGSYKYIVLDESHFLFSDANFNSKTRFACEELITKSHSNSIKIFISATMEELKDAIEYKREELLFKAKIIEYKTGIDYSYVNPIYLKNDMDTIINTIKNDVTEEKWLIFVSKKSEGNEILEQLGSNICSTIYSDTKSDELESIVNNSKFNKKVLICTKCLDNGINIQDKLLTNIVIMAWDRVTFIQMLGRKRVDIDNAQEVNLYIPIRYKKSFSTKVYNLNKDYAEVRLLDDDENAFNLKYDNGLEDIAKLKHLFYKSNKTGKWTRNTVGLHRLLLDLNFNEKMVTAFDDNGKYAFILKQLEWLGLKECFDESNILDGVVLNKDVETLEDYLESVINIKVLKDDQEILKQLLTSEAFKIDRSLLQGTKKMHPSTFNSIMQETLRLPYQVIAIKTSERINGKPKKYTYWTIIKTLK